MSTPQKPPATPSPIPEAAPTPPMPPSTRRRGFLGTLPWILVALLTGLSVWLGMWQVQTQQQLDALKRTATSPSAAASGATEQGHSDRLKAVPREGGKADLIKGLARRQADDPRALGKVDAPNVMLEWADYRCPFCAKWSIETKPELMALVNSGQLRIEFHDMVLFGEESMLTHKAARAAGLQGRYWEYADAIWRIHTGQGHPSFTQQTAEKLAAEAGVADLARFKADMSSPAIAKEITAETQKAQQLGITGTPFFLVNTTPVSGAVPTEQFLDLLAQYGAKK